MVYPRIGPPRNNHTSRHRWPEQRLKLTERTLMLERDKARPSENRLQKRSPVIVNDQSKVVAELFASLQAWLPQGLPHLKPAKKCSERCGNASPLWLIVASWFHLYFFHGHFSEGSRLTTAVRKSGGGEAPLCLSSVLLINENHC